MPKIMHDYSAFFMKKRIKVERPTITIKQPSIGSGHCRKECAQQSQNES